MLAVSKSNGASGVRNAAGKKKEYERRTCARDLSSSISNTTRATKAAAEGLLVVRSAYDAVDTGKSKNEAHIARRLYVRLRTLWAAAEY